MPVLIVNRPGEEPIAYEFLAIDAITIGRSTLNEICVADRALSDVHAQITFQDNEYYLADLGSRFGTYYNGRFLTGSVVLHPGGRIQLGSTEIEFRELPDSLLTAAAEVTSARSDLLLSLEETDPNWLVYELYQRAARHYESAGLLRDAAECLLDGGNSREAISIYLRTEDYASAAPLLMEQGRYSEALQCYRAWNASLKADNFLNRINALLGEALSLRRMNAEPENAMAAYRQARALAEAPKRDRLMEGSCWESFGMFAAKIGRTDLVQIAYEQALNAYGTDYNEDRLRATVSYMAAVKDNRLLVAEIEGRLTEWQPEIVEAPPDETSSSETHLLTGARWGDWTVWRPAPKELVLVHATSATAIEIWADSWGWFRWSKGQSGQMVRSDGSITTNIGPVNIDPYVDKVPTGELSSVSADVINYTFIWSRDSLRIGNRIKGGTIILYPTTPIFQYVPNDRPAIVLS